MSQPSTIKWADAEGQEAKLTLRQQTVLDTLRTTGGDRRLLDLTTSTGLSEQETWAALRRLRDLGLAKCVRRGVYRLVEGSPATDSEDGSAGRMATLQTDLRNTCRIVADLENQYTGAPKNVVVELTLARIHLETALAALDLRL